MSVFKKIVWDEHIKTKKIFSDTLNAKKFILDFLSIGSNNKVTREEYATRDETLSKEYSGELRNRIGFLIGIIIFIALLLIHPSKMKKPFDYTQGSIALGHKMVSVTVRVTKPVS